MNRLKEFKLILQVQLSRLLSKLSSILNAYANKLMAEPTKDLSLNKPVVEEDMGVVDFALRNNPNSFVTFKEGLASKDYCTRHDAASQLVGWYTSGQGSPLLEDLLRAAEVLTEDSLADKKDVSYLVGAWKDQASAVTEEQRETAQQREDAIYADLKGREKKVLESQIKSAEQDKLQ